MQFVRVDFWPAGLVFVSAVAVALVLRALERFAHSATTQRTRRALARALGDPATEAPRGGADTGVG
jgi:hypothetical protein